MELLVLPALGPMKRPAKRVSLVSRSTMVKINGLFAMKVGVILAMSGTIAISVI